MRILITWLLYPINNHRVINIPFLKNNLCNTNRTFPEMKSFPTKDVTLSKICFILSADPTVKENLLNRAQGITRGPCQPQPNGQRKPIKPSSRHRWIDNYIFKKSDLIIKIEKYFLSGFAREDWLHSSHKNTFLRKVTYRMPIRPILKLGTRWSLFVNMNLSCKLA